MGANRGQEDGGNVRVNEGAAGGQRIGGAAGGGAEDDAVSLHEGEEVVVAVEFEVRDVGGWSAVDDELVEDFELLSFDGVALVVTTAATGGRGCGAVDGAGETHAKVHAHAFVTHDSVERLLVVAEVEVGEEAERAEGKGEDWWDDALKEPGGVEHGAVAAEGQDEVEFLRARPAKVGRPVAEHGLELGVLGHQFLRVETFGAAQLGVDVDVDAHVVAVARCREQELGQLAREGDEVIVSGLGDDHDGPDSSFDRTALQLLRHFAHAGGSLHQPTVRKTFVVFETGEHGRDVDGIVEAPMEEAWRLQRGQTMRLVGRVQMQVAESLRQAPRETRRAFNLCRAVLDGAVVSVEERLDGRVDGEVRDGRRPGHKRLHDGLPGN